MAYDQNTPVNINERFSASQPKITANFIALKTSLDVDHIPMDAASGNQGKHNSVTMPERAADPGNIAINQITMYSKLSAITAEAGLFLQKEGTGAVAGSVIEMTAAVTADTGYTYLPSGVMLQWGSTSVAANTPGNTKVFATPFKVGCIMVLLMPNANIDAGRNSADSIARITAKTRLQFTFSRLGTYQASSMSYKFLAIGY